MDPVRSLGIVGHEGKKFTVETEALAKQKIHEWLDRLKPEIVVSGRCPLGGIDVWAEEIAITRGIETRIHYPTVHRWGAKGGFKERNLRIANDSDLVLVIVVKDLPSTYKGLRFKSCYHCAQRGAANDHVKSGGCWTAWKAIEMSKKGYWEII